MTRQGIEQAPGAAIGGAFYRMALYTRGPYIYSRLEQYRVEELTLTGMWLRNGYERTWRKRNTRYVRATVEEALRDLEVRKQYYVKHAEARLKKAQSELRRAQELAAADHNKLNTTERLDWRMG